MPTDGAKYHTTATNVKQHSKPLKHYKCVWTHFFPENI